MSRHPMRRIVAAGTALVLMVGWFVVRLVDIQVVRAAELNEASQDVRSETETVYGERGRILDANGTVLAEPVMRYHITISPKQAMATESFERTAADGADEDVTRDEALEQLGAALGRTGADIRSEIDEALAADPKADFAYLAKRVDTEVYETVKALRIPFVYSKEAPARRYPNGSVAGNLIGFVTEEGEPGAGLEYSENTCLASEDGERTWLHSLKDWVAIPGTEVVNVQPHDGGDLQLTIDADLQYYVQRVAAEQVRATAADWATVTVMEAKTGRLLAVADVPTVDPNAPSATDEGDRGSRAFTAPFEPGSTFKALTAASVIDAGEGDAKSRVTADYRYIAPNGADVNDSFYHGPTNYTMTGMLIDSSNTAMSLFGEKVSDEQRYQDMVDFGLGEPTEVGFASEAGGDLHGGPDEWDNQTRYATMFGQGLTTTSIQIASVYQTLANGGVRMPVTLVDGCLAADGTLTDAPAQEGRRVVSEKAADQTSLMLEQVYREGWLADQWNIPGYRVAAKTGTAQVPDGQGGYQAGYLVSVSGFAPADDPEFVVSVSIMNPVKMNSSAASAPVFQQVMSQVLKKYRTVPSGAQAPELPATW
ncbi:peptidoglycan D,D-transpeptidase FtsI family protein [Agromyces marinus]|uniref:peptidoglycan D,D-transpeptidase FtsI family protein n=1 Tax=Agromyces marinus TaxID=1389020 RepID=UPI001F3D21AC|nr:penicillin-binding protein 2 [Agromyces marinus]